MNETEIEHDVEREYWGKRLEEIRKACCGTAPGEPPLPSRAEGYAGAAEKFAAALRKEIPDEIVKDGRGRVSHRVRNVEVPRVSENDGEKRGRFVIAIRLPYRTYAHCRLYLGCNGSESGFAVRLSYDCPWLSTAAAVDIRDCGWESIVEQVARFRKNHPRYCDELEEAVDLAVEKRKKTEQMAKNAIRAAVPRMMAATGLEWNLEEEQERAVLLVKMPRAKMLRITLGYKSYMDKLPELANVIDQMKRLIETIPYPVEVGNLGRNVKWKKGAET